MAQQPSQAILKAFGVAGETPSSLPGGQGVSFRAGSLVLKPTSNEALYEDMARVATVAAAAGAPLIAPVQSGIGSFVVDGWMATQVVDNTGLEWQHDDCDWGAVFDAARQMHSALAEIPVPASFRVFRSRSRWDQADRAVWTATLPDLDAAYEAPARRLLEALRPVEYSEQIVHGDIGGNVLRRLDGSRLIIDFSPYQRPTKYAEATIAVDALLWYQASTDIVDLLTPGDRQQYLLRATLFRLLCDGIFYRDNPGPAAAVALASYDRVFATVEADTRRSPL